MLLKRLAPSRDVDVLLGDITEEARHRSRLWRWGQLIAVVMVTAWTDVRAHQWLAVRATITGVLTLTVFMVPASLAALIVSPYLYTATGFALSGWMVARVHRQHGFAMVLPYLGLVCVIPALVMVRLLTLSIDYVHGIGWPEVSPLFLHAFDTFAPAWVLSGAILGTREEHPPVIDAPQ